ncbi:unnamed protein product [Prorocentrum cordatum]|uniref:Protein-ribulosamine 3-kinase n=1 Tax=Prorocentrum cordatum TaxID=2364126 RepID=A0ABN9VUL5_9DINO|nr:unnamed protein product [Polarella glacialis]
MSPDARRSDPARPGGLGADTARAEDRSASAECPPACACCKPPPPCAGGRGVGHPSVAVHGDPAEVRDAPDAEVGAALQRVFGPQGLQLLFGVPSSAGVSRIHRGGMNHVFMAAGGGRLLKCTLPQCAPFSEVLEAERIRRDIPGLVSDVHAVFPTAGFLCQERPAGLPGAHPTRCWYSNT